MAARRPPVLLGRVRERQAFDRLLDNVRRGQSAVLVVRGEAGVGKTALLHHCARQAARRLREGGAIVTVSRADAITPALADQLSERGITVNGYAPGIELPGTVHDVEELVSLLDRRRRP